jgi:hypothetical protein
VRGQGVTFDKLTPFCKLSLHAAEAPWLIVKNPDQNERSHRARCPDDLYDYLHPRICRRGRPAKQVQSRWTVTDEWPDEVPITEAEIEVFEAWFGDLFDELFSIRH